MSPLIAAGEAIRSFAALLQLTATYLANIALAVAIALVLIRFLVDRYNINPFGRIVYYARRPTEKWFYAIKNSQFYRPIKQALGFEPIWLMLLLGFVILFFLLRSLISDVTLLLGCVSETLFHFGRGDTILGTRALIGTLLLGIIYFLMALMTILVIHSWFGLFERAGFWAGRRIYPILLSFDPSGRLGPLIFLLAFLLLSLVAGAVQLAFF
ncbi:MAG TPA: hypothetical protein VHR27_05715 [Blastocatellia bacterium]|jgi:hypothetical protein|nr:hypothetical protein [Blastocatellia bacterium]